MGLISDRTEDRTVDDRVIDLTVTGTPPTSWLTASTSVGHVSPPRRRGWRLSSPPDRPVPKGEMHAYNAGDEVAVCGVPLASLHAWEDQPFGDGLLNRCEDCLHRTRDR